MRGCSGCLLMVVLVGALALAVGGLVGAGLRMLAAPPGAAALPDATPADGSRAQQKLFEIARSSRLTHPVTLSEAEINGLLRHHLVEARGVRLGGVAVRLIGANRVELTGQTPLRQLLDEAGLQAFSGVIPTTWLEHRMWIRVGARAHVNDAPGRRLSLEVEDFAVGRQRLPARTLRLLLDPAAVGLLQWPLPEHVHDVTVEPGRVVIRGTSSR